MLLVYHWSAPVVHQHGVSVSRSQGRALVRAPADHHVGQVVVRRRRVVAGAGQLAVDGVAGDQRVAVVPAQLTGPPMLLPSRLTGPEASTATGPFTFAASNVTAAASDATT